MAEHPTEDAADKRHDCAHMGIDAMHWDEARPAAAAMVMVKIESFMLSNTEDAYGHVRVLPSALGNEAVLGDDTGPPGVQKEEEDAVQCSAVQCSAEDVELGRERGSVTLLTPQLTTPVVFCLLGHN